MKKSTNKYRQCANCPHTVMERKCCCQRTSASTMRNKALTSRPKKEQSTIDNSSVVNTTIPTIIAQFSALRTQNNHLKRQLLNVSTFLKDDPHQATSINHSEPSLNQKLFISNKNLKQALLEIDNLSKINKQLYDRNTHLAQQSQGLKIQMRQIESYLDRYKKKCKKYSRAFEQLPERKEVNELYEQNVMYQQENKALKEEIRCLKFQNKNFSMIGNLSPEWVAQTGNKLARNQHFGGRGNQGNQMQMFKKSLSQTINLLKNQSSHFQNTSFDNVGNAQFVGLQNLIQTLIQSYSQSIFAHFSLLVKEMNRKLNTYQKKISNLTSKLQNFLIIFRNKRLRKKLAPTLSFIKTERTPMADITNRI